MPVVIMKTDSSPVAGDWVRPHSVWKGKFKDAVEWCSKKNEHPNNHTTIYEAVKVKGCG